MEDICGTLTSAIESLLAYGGTRKDITPALYRREPASRLPPTSVDLGTNTESRNGWLYRCIDGLDFV